MRLSVNTGCRSAYMLPVTQQSYLHQAARQLFDSALSTVDAREAVETAVTLDDERLMIAGVEIDPARYRSGVYSIAIGKAAAPMAIGLENTLGQLLKEGVIAGPVAGQPSVGELLSWPRKRTTVLRLCQGGHPLPNKGSLIAAQECFRLLERANVSDASVIFLISGGGSA